MGLALSKIQTRNYDPKRIAPKVGSNILQLSKKSANTSTRNSRKYKRNMPAMESEQKEEDKGKENDAMKTQSSLEIPEISEDVDFYYSGSDDGTFSQ